MRNSINHMSTRVLPALFGSGDKGYVDDGLPYTLFFLDVWINRLNIFYRKKYINEITNY